MLLKRIIGILPRGAAFIFEKMWMPFALLLLLQLALLYAAVSEISVPARIVRHFLEKTETEGVRCEIGEVRVRNLTVLTAKDVRADTLLSREPLLRVRRCAVRLAHGSLVSGRLEPDLVYADGVEIFCPSMTSASGKSEKLVSDGALAAYRRGGNVEIASAKFRCGGAKFIVCGAVPGTRDFFFGNAERDEKEDVPATDERRPLGAVFSQAAGTLSAVTGAAPLRPFLDSGTFSVRISPEGSALNFSAEAFFDETDVAERLRLKKASAACEISVNPASARILPRGPLTVSAENAEFFAGEAFAERVCGNVAKFFAVAKLPDIVHFPDAEISACLPKSVSARAERVRAASLTAGSVELGGLLLRVSPQAGAALFPGTYRVEANAALGSALFSAAGTVFADAENPSARLAYEVSANPKDLLAFPQLRLIAKQKDVAALRFSEKTNLRGNADFAAGMKFERATLEFSSGEIQLEDKTLKALRVAGTLTPDAVYLSEIKALGPDFCANADVFTELSAAGDFRVRAWGTVDPSCIDGRLGWFWERIWRDLRPAPSETRPRADIDVYGNWSDKWEHVFGAIAGENCWGNGVLVDKVRLRVYEDPLLIAAFDMGFVRGNDLVRGNLQWHYAMEPEYHYRDFRFLFDGSIPPNLVLKIIGEGLPEALSELETAGAGTAVVSGMFSGDPRYYPERMLVNVEGEVPGAFSIFGIEGEDFRGKIIYDNGVVLVGAPFSARSDEGSVSGNIRVTLPEDGHGAAGSKVALALNLKNVRRSRLADSFSAIVSRVEPPPGANDAESVPAAKETAAAGTETAEGVPAEAAKEDKSGIDAVFAGTMTIPDLKSLDAEGAFSMKDPDLFKLQIFGGFSRMLSALKIDFTTFELNRAESSYTVRDGVVFLPNLRVFGDSGELNVRAGVTLPEQTILGEAVFRNLRGTRIPLLGKIVEWGSASTELLPVKISGTLENFEWSVAPDITRIWSSPTDGFGVAPDAPAKNADGGNAPAGTEDDERTD